MEAHTKCNILICTLVINCKNSIKRFLSTEKKNVTIIMDGGGGGGIVSVF